MLRNYLLVAFRSLRRRPGYSTINVAGLSVGIACCAIIALYIWSELAYDRFHEDADRIYRIESTWAAGFSLPATNWPLVELLRDEQPQLDVTTILRTNSIVHADDRSFREDVLLIADSAFFEIFNFSLESGSEDDALTHPYTVVLTRALAEKYFGDGDPLGRTIRAFGELALTVTGVLSPPAGPTHLPVTALISWPTLESIGWTANQAWGNNSVNTYLRLPDGHTPNDVLASLETIVARHAGDDWNGSQLGLQRVVDIHLWSRHTSELQPGGNPRYVSIFAAVAVFILILAAVNFVNLSTARSLERAREVGVRKSVGAARSQLARQFLVEAVVLSALALVAAAAIVAAVLPLLSGFLGRPLLPDARTMALAAVGAGCLSLAVGIGGGIYPAVSISRYRPADVLRGRFAGGFGGARLRQVLVVFQFAVAVFLLVGTIVVYGQLRHLRQVDLGFAQEQVLVLEGAGVGAPQRLAFFDALRREPAVRGVASMSEPMPAELLSGWTVLLPGAVPSLEEQNANSTRMLTVSADFFGTLGIPFIAGRDFRAGSAADSSGIVLNESAARRVIAQAPDAYSTPHDLIGAQVDAGGARRNVVGVVPDVHLSSLHRRVEATAFYYGQADNTYLVRISPRAAAAAIDVVRRRWQAHFPDAPLEYHFADEAFDATYRSEEQLASVVLLFTALAILVACLGLFGLAAYAAERRRKEIGVRKVLGASIAGVVRHLSTEFLRLVAIGVVVAVPVAYAAMSRWLDEFPSRVELGPGPFLLAGAAAIAIALVTVSGQALRAAAADPAEVLRYD